MRPANAAKRTNGVSLGGAHWELKSKRFQFATLAPLPRLNKSVHGSNKPVDYEFERTLRIGRRVNGAESPRGNYGRPRPKLARLRHTAENRAVQAALGTRAECQFVFPAIDENTNLRTMLEKSVRQAFNSGLSCGRTFGRVVQPI